MTSPIIHTIGYEGASIENLIAALIKAEVEVVVDIRESPYSRRSEFSKEEIASALAAYGLAYCHIRELGNPLHGRDAARAGHNAAYREIFAAHLDSTEGRKGLAMAAALAANKNICLLCLEKSASNCHRIIVAGRLAAMSGQEVVHLKVAPGQSHPGQGSFAF